MLFLSLLPLLASFTNAAAPNPPATAPLNTFGLSLFPFTQNFTYWDEYKITANDANVPTYSTGAYYLQSSFKDKGTNHPFRLVNGAVVDYFNRKWTVNTNDLQAGIQTASSGYAVLSCSFAGTELSCKVGSRSVYIYMYDMTGRGIVVSYSPSIIAKVYYERAAIRSVTLSQTVFLTDQSQYSFFKIQQKLAPGASPSSYANYYFGDADTPVYSTCAFNLDTRLRLITDSAAAVGFFQLSGTKYAGKLFDQNGRIIYGEKLYDGQETFVLRSRPVSNFPNPDVPVLGSNEFYPDFSVANGVISGKYGKATQFYIAVNGDTPEIRLSQPGRTQTSTLIPIVANTNTPSNLVQYKEAPTGQPEVGIQVECDNKYFAGAPLTTSFFQLTPSGYLLDRTSSRVVVVNQKLLASSSPSQRESVLAATANGRSATYPLVCKFTGSALTCTANNVALRFFYSNDRNTDGNFIYLAKGPNSVTGTEVLLSSTVTIANVNYPKPPPVTYNLAFTLFYVTPQWAGDVGYDSYGISTQPPSTDTFLNISPGLRNSNFVLNDFNQLLDFNSAYGRVAQIDSNGLLAFKPTWSSSNALKCYVFPGDYFGINFNQGSGTSTGLFLGCFAPSQQSIILDVYSGSDSTGYGTIAWQTYRPLSGGYGPTNRLSVRTGPFALVRDSAYNPGGQLLPLEVSL